MTNDELEEIADLSKFEYVKTEKVTDKYSVVCGKCEGENWSFHVKDGKIVEVENNWEPKDRYK